MQHNTGIYEIRNTVNGKRYIGSAVSFWNRWRQHVQSLARGNHHSIVLQRAWDMYGPRAFQFNKLVACEKKDLILYEQLLMDAMKPKYNIAPVAGSQLGFKHSDESRKRMSDSRPRDFSPMTGKSHGPEVRARISASRKGKGLGPQSEERRAKISAAHKGRVISAEQRAMISKTLTGHKQSQEQVAKRMANMPLGHYERVAAAKRKLSIEQVREVRFRKEGGEKYSDIAIALNVSRQTVADIACGRRYKDVS